MESGDDKPLSKEGPKAPRELSQGPETPALIPFLQAPRQPRRQGLAPALTLVGTLPREEEAWRALGLCRGGNRLHAGR